MAASHAFTSPRAFCGGTNCRAVLCPWGFGGLGEAFPSPEFGLVRSTDGCAWLERHCPVAKERLGRLARVGTRKAATEDDTATPREFVRNACVRALRKHVCAVLIEGWRRGGEGDCVSAPSS